MYEEKCLASNTSAQLIVDTFCGYSKYVLLKLVLHVGSIPKTFARQTFVLQYQFICNGQIPITRTSKRDLSSSNTQSSFTKKRSTSAG